MEQKNTPTFPPSSLSLSLSLSLTISFYANKLGAKKYISAGYLCGNIQKEDIDTY